MARYIFSVLLLLGCFSLIACASTLDREDGYRCAEAGTCALPEAVPAGESLIYLIRPYRLLNQGEKLDVYVTRKDKKEQQVARIFGSQYCPVRTRDQEILLRVSGYKNDSSLLVSTFPDGVYYVLLDTTIKSGTKLYVNLKQVDKATGERLLKNEVMSSCPNPL